MKLKDYRAQSGLTQAELGGRCGCSQGAIAHYETGNRTPDVYTLRKIQKAFASQGLKVSLDELVDSLPDRPDTFAA